ncbi:unnamed protein product [Paramecium sonneborni]|uniref:Uncharacterized protein n=1 Tax=Paramecium sonneborni TaxID=65129 RepID=A0A8S1RJW9_9CILI|nr:unnamed protein product [Paramecium sonneborni]
MIKINENYNYLNLTIKIINLLLVEVTIFLQNVVKHFSHLFVQYQNLKKLDLKLKTNNINQVLSKMVNQSLQKLPYFSHLIIIFQNYPLCNEGLFELGEGYHNQIVNKGQGYGGICKKFIEMIEIKIIKFDIMEQFNYKEKLIGLKMMEQEGELIQNCYNLVQPMIYQLNFLPLNNFKRYSLSEAQHTDKPQLSKFNCFAYDFISEQDLDQQN